MQAVGYLDKDDTDVVGHGKQQLLEVLCLCGSPVSEDAAGNLGQSVHDLGNLRAEDILDIFHRIIGIFHHIVQQGGTDGSRTQANLRADNSGHGNGVEYVGFSRTAFDTLVCLVGEVECLGYDLDTFAVFGCQIVVQQFLECLFNHFFFGSLFLLLAYMFFHILFSLFQFTFCKNKQISTPDKRFWLYLYIFKRFPAEILVLRSPFQLFN